MIRNNNQSQSGFSAVELLITLFIAVAFIGAGYQIYSVILKDSGDARLRAVANDIAYENLRKYTSQASTPCSVVPASPAPTFNNPSGLPPGATITATFSCPYGTADPTTKLVVTILYGNPQQEVTHALFITP